MLFRFPPPGSRVGYIEHIQLLGPVLPPLSCKSSSSSCSGSVHLTSRHGFSFFYQDNLWATKSQQVTAWLHVKRAYVNKCKISKTVLSDLIGPSFHLSYVFDASLYV